MKLKLKVDNTTSVEELALLGAFFTGLAGERSYLPPVFVAPTDEAELPPEPSCVTLNREEPVVHVEAPKRRRRTKAEIAAMDAVGEVVAVEPEPEVAPEPEPEVAPEPEIEASLNAEAAGQAAYDLARNQPDPEPEVAAASTSKVPTPAELNTKAAAVAKKIGPEKIRDRIRELGGTLISTLAPAALIEFNEWLDQQ
jgi:hypothetical protein